MRYYQLFFENSVYVWINELELWDTAKVAVTATASSLETGYPIANAFDGNPSTVWHSNYANLNWVKMDCGSDKNITQYKIICSATYTPTTWYFLGSNDNIHWDVLDKQINYAWAGNYNRTFSVGLPTPKPLVSTFDSSILADNPTAYYPLKELNTSTAYDYVGTLDGLHFDSNWTELIKAQSNNIAYSFYLDGNNSVSLPDNPLLNFSSLNAFTIECFVWLPIMNTSEQTIITLRDCPYLVLSNGYITFGCSTGNVSYFDSALYSGQVSHIVGVYENNQLKLYLNGSLKQSTTIAAPTLGTNERRIGCALNLTKYLQGSIQSVALYRKALSASTILNHYQQSGLVNQDIPRRLYGSTKPVIMNPGKNNTTINIFCETKKGLSKDFEDGGYTTIIDKVTEEGTPVSRKVRLLNANNGRLIRETWSDLQGNFTFYQVASRDYLIISHDYNKVFKSIIIDRKI